MTLLVFLASLYTPLFVVDSWSYLELSNTVFKDFYHFNTLRQFESHSPYSNAFPPLWPVLLAVARRPVDLGIYTGYVLNCFICIGLLAALIRLFQRLGLPGWAGAACYLSALGFLPFFADALGAKTSPLALLLLVTVLVILFRDSLTIPRIALAGLLMGLACLNRFDALPTACVLGIAFATRIYSLNRKLSQSIFTLAVYFAILGVTLSPWAVFGARHFGKRFPSADTRPMMLARDGYTLNYYETPPPSDLTQHPGKWIAGLVSAKLPRVAFGLYDSAVRSALPLFLGIVLVVWGAGQSPPFSRTIVQFCVFALVLIPVLLFPTTLVGYRDARYYSGPILLLFAILFAILISLTPGAWNLRRSSLLLVASLLPLGAVFDEPLNAFSNGIIPLSLKKAMAPLSADAEMERLTDAVRRDAGGAPHRLVLTTGYVASARYGALTGEPVSLMPRLVGGTFAAFARDWHITHVYNPPGPLPVTYAPPITDPEIVMRSIKAPGIELVPLDLPGLYRIQLTAEASH